MYNIQFTEEEFKALYAVFSTAARIDWAAYDRAKTRILDAGVEKGLHEAQEEDFVEQ